MGKRLYIGNVNYEATENDLRDVFRDYIVMEVKIVMDKDTGRPRGFCFVELDSDKAAADAVQHLDGIEMMGRTLKVSEAQERTNGRGRTGGGGRGDDRGRREDRGGRREDRGNGRYRD